MGFPRTPGAVLRRGEGAAAGLSPGGGGGDFCGGARGGGQGAAASHREGGGRWIFVRARAQAVAVCVFRTMCCDACELSYSFEARATVWLLLGGAELRSSRAFWCRSCSQQMDGRGAADRWTVLGLRAKIPESGVRVKRRPLASCRIIPAQSVTLPYSLGRYLDL